LIRDELETKGRGGVGTGGGREGDII